MKKAEKEAKQIYINIIDGDLVHTATITEKEYNEKYSDYEIVEECEGEDQATRIIKAKK